MKHSLLFGIWLSGFFAATSIERYLQHKTTFSIIFIVLSIALYWVASKKIQIKN